MTEGKVGKNMENNAEVMGIDCLCAGILFVDYLCDSLPRLPRAGELLRTGGITIAPGGCASNVGTDLAKLGVRVGVSGCVGADASGRLLREALTEAGTDVTGIREIDAQTAAGLNAVSDTDVTRTAGTMVVNVDGDDRRFISTPGASDAFRAAMIPEAWIEQAKVFYVGGYLMLPALEDDAFVELLRRLRERGCRTILDVVLMSSDTAYFERVLRRVLPHTDLFMPNDDEAAAITGRTDPLEQAQWFRDLGAHDICITLGASGAMFVSDRHTLRCGVYPTTFIGGTGSGDAFGAGFIAAILDGLDDADCLRWGAALGASCVRSVTACDGVFTRFELLDFIARHPLKIEQM